MTIEDQVKSEVERVNRIFRSAAEKMDADIDYARATVIEKGVLPPEIDPDHLTLRNMIDLLATRQLEVK